MIKVEASKDEFGNYDAKEVVKIVRKGFEAGETEFSTPASGYGNQEIMNVRSIMRDKYNRDSDPSWEAEKRVEALRWVLIGLALDHKDSDLMAYDFVYDESTDVITFKIMVVPFKLIQLSKLTHGNNR